uniref:Photosystem II CP47 reaction center protein n=1 Tax=Lingulaulax polyedra TaxID=160621 RepID=Q2I6P8_LINPO|nr:photosystem II chlorophyll-binding protein CP-47 [Lingulodinium polyedra]
MGLPWFRVHICILNDPGRLISVHIMHNALVAGWSGVMLLYELIIQDPSDPVLNPIWRQGCYVMPFVSRLGVVRSFYDWSLGIELESNYFWTYETVSGAHILLSGLFILAAFWHWSYWDLDVFVSVVSGNFVLDLNRIFGLHLSLAAIVCFGFGLAHLTGFFGPGFWTSDSFGIVGSVRFVKPVYSLIGLSPFCYGVISSNHIGAGFFGIFLGLWHISTRPGPLLYKLLGMGNIESVLSSSISSVFFSAFVTSGLMWYGSVSTALELFGPSRYHWDNGYFSIDIERRVNNIVGKNFDLLLNKAWEQVPEKLVFYDYIGCNPSKGGLFRSGPMIKGDGIVQNWLGHASFEMGTLSLTVRRMPAFFETFPVILIDQGGSVRADIPFRRAESRYSIEQTSVVLYFQGGILSGVEYSTPSLVKSYARKSQFGEIFTFDKKTGQTDGVFRTSPRCWYSFSHVTLAFIFFFGHLWHAGRALFRDIWTGVSIISLYQVEYGRNEKLGEDVNNASALI